MTTGLTMTKIYNRPSEKTKRRYLRSHMTSAEILLWRYLKGKQLLSHKFRRQYSVGPYVLDFYCPEARLAIEVDGGSHHSKSARAHDRRKAQYIERFNISVLRFSDENVFSNLDGVLKCIGAAIPSRRESSSIH